MAYRDQNSTAGADPLKGMLQDIQLRLRRLEEARNPTPDPSWVLEESENGLHYLWVPTGSRGPVIGTK